MKKIKVGILFGGKSVEHEVSLQSARNVIEAIDRDKFDIVLIGINKDGQWLLNDSAEQFLIADSGSESLSISGNQVALIPESGGNLTSLTNIQSHSTLDVVFPLLHGTYGEDGTIQGLLKLANVPFVGAGVLASAVGLDKDVAKRLLRDAGIPVGQFIAIRSGDTIDTDHIIQQLGLPLFVKPANLGSSVGIRKVKDAPSLYEAIEFAFLYDNKVLIEAYIQGRELECAVLGNRDPVASIVGEVKAHQD
ncbi:MAG: D-alanine--D-alanine ligase family protein, partial [Pseudomonadota bacterium]